MNETYGNYASLSWNYQNHGFEEISLFPSSETFYQEDLYNIFPFMQKVKSFIYLNTCNRSELYFEFNENLIALNGSVGKLKDAIKKQIENYLSLKHQKSIILSEPNFNISSTAACHIIRVVSGLESMALGETQITGQFKRDLKRAEKNNLVSKKFANFCSKALEVQKKIRTETLIGQKPLSLISLLDNEIKSDKSLLKRCAIGGTGDMARKAAQYLLSQDIASMIVLRKDKNQALPEDFQNLLTKFDNKKIEVAFASWDELDNVNNFKKEYANFHSIDIFISSAQTTSPLINKSLFDELVKNNILNEKSIMVDLGIPDNFAIEGHATISLKSLLSQSEANKQLRKEHLAETTPYIKKGIQEFWLDNIYRKNSKQVYDLMGQIEAERKQEWDSLFNGPLADITNKQKRILQDHFRKQEKKSIHLHKDLLVNMISEKLIPIK